AQKPLQGAGTLLALSVFTLLLSPSPAAAQSGLWAWGDNRSGQLGDGTHDANPHTTPRQVIGPGGLLSGVVSLAAGDDYSIAAIAAGANHSLALKSDGTVWAWGANGLGQLGDGTTTDRRTPVRINSLTNVVSIACGEFHSLAVKADGTVWAWGDDSSAQLGDN